MSHHGEHDEFGGLHRDLLRTGTTMDRRQLLRAAARFGVSLGALQLFGCTSTGLTETDTDTGTGSGACTKIPEETAGPYPGEGSNGPNVLNQTGVVRSDIRSSFAGLAGTADCHSGAPLPRGVRTSRNQRLSLPAPALLLQGMRVMNSPDIIVVHRDATRKKWWRLGTPSKGAEPVA